MSQNLTKSLLLLCDVQSSFAPHIHGFEHVVRGINKFLKIAKVLSIPTVSTTQYARALGSLDAALQPNLDALAAANLHHGPTDKKFFSMCIPEVLEFITNDIDRVIIVGIESHICVTQTMRDLRLLFPNAPSPFDRAATNVTNFNEYPAHLSPTLRDRAKPLHLTVLADCVSSANAFEVPIALETMRSQLNVQISSSESTAFDLIGSAANPLFKVFSQVIKDEKDTTQETTAFWADSRM